mgnify:CR=1 FL=1
MCIYLKGLFNYISIDFGKKELRFVTKLVLSLLTLLKIKNLIFIMFVTF